MTVLLTGGSGFLGSHIAEQLNQNGETVRALVRPTSDISFLETLDNVEIIKTSLADKNVLNNAVQGVDGIIHSAALIKAVNEKEFKKVNIDYTRYLLEAAAGTRETLKRFVFVSSIAAVGPNTDGDIIQDGKSPTPVTCYGRSKLAAEQVVQDKANELPITILRPVSLYGPRDKATFILFKSINNRVLPYCGSPDTQLMFLYGADFARACILALQANVPSGSSYIIDNGKVYTWKELLTLTESIIGKKALIRFPVPRFLIYIAALALDVYSKISRKAFILSRDKMNELYEQFVTDSKEGQKMLNWTPETNLEEGLKTTFHWYKKNNWL